MGSGQSVPGYAPNPQGPGFIPGPGQQTIVMPIPNDLAGSIIGKGGIKINEIRQVSTAQVKVGNSVPGAIERQVTITGTPQAIQMAQYLIQQRLQEGAAGKQGYSGGYGQVR